MGYRRGGLHFQSLVWSASNLPDRTQHANISVFFIASCINHNSAFQARAHELRALLVFYCLTLLGWLLLCAAVSALITIQAASHFAAYVRSQGVLGTYSFSGFSCGFTYLGCFTDHRLMIRYLGCYCGVVRMHKIRSIRMCKLLCVMPNPRKHCLAPTLRLQQLYLHILQAGLMNSHLSCSIINNGT